MNMGNDESRHRRRRVNRTFRFVMIVAVMVLIMRGLLFLIDDSYRMTPEEGARLPPVVTPAPEH